jgi:hypothetical protein
MLYCVQVDKDMRKATTMEAERQATQAWGMEIAECDGDGLIRVRYTKENPNRGFFRQFDDVAELRSWVAAMQAVNGDFERVEYVANSVWSAV